MYVYNLFNTEWRACANVMACSVKTVDAYMKRYGTHCTANPTCEDYVRIHHGGPKGCTLPSTSEYWSRDFMRCCDKGSGC